MILIGTLIALLATIVFVAILLWFLAAVVFVKVAKFALKLARPFIDNLKKNKGE
ncbi:hypothetical protein [Paenibacillus sp. PDC88]|uniref:hypothetical protein n=1 Tax=Paenibacillus sp. PDC88 TaxID=1884375 RepID=UPI0015A7132E|nr:hypothetical protein [Paenibacillus sp. PDC88]